MMRNPLSKKITGIEPSGIRKFFDLVSEMPDAISLGVGEPDFDTPWRIREEGIYTLEQGKTFYTSNAGLKDLKIEISKYLERKIHVEYDPDHEIMVTVGGSEGIDVALRAMLDPGDEVLIPQPSYVSYTPCTILADGVPVTIQLEEKDKFRLTKEKLLEKITPKTKVLILPFPNNPTGSIMEPEDLAEIAKICIEKDLFVISDEIYSELTYKGQHCTIAAFPGMKERTVLINGFSKSFAMTGWRLGWAVMPDDDDVLEAVDDLATNYYLCAHTPTQHAALACFTPESLAECEARRQELLARRRIVIDGLKRIGLPVEVEPNGAFYAYFDISRTGLDAWTFCERALDEAHVALTPGRDFGAATADTHVRLSYAASREALTEGLERLGTFVESL